MVYKAAGLLSEFVKQQEPIDIIKLLFIALNQQDIDLLDLIYNGEAESISKIINQVEMVRMVQQSPLPSIKGILLYEIPVFFKLKENGKREVDSYYVFTLKRDSPTSEWKLTDLPFNQVKKK